MSYGREMRRNAELKIKYPYLYYGCADVVEFKSATSLEEEESQLFKITISVTVTKKLIDVKLVAALQ